MISTDSGVEAFVRADSHEHILSALKVPLGQLIRDYALLLEAQYLYKGRSATVLISSSADNFLSVWVRNDSHWQNDVEFGRFLSRSTGVVVRCDPGSSFPDVNPHSDVFLEISECKEELIQWKG